MGNKNIDKLFQEQFKNFHQEPNPAAWKNIKNNLNTKKPKKSIPFWMIFSGVAATISLLLIVSIVSFSNTKSSTNTVEKPNTETSKTLQNKKGYTPKLNTKTNAIVNNNKAVLQKNEHVIPAKNKTQHSAIAPRKNTVVASEKENHVISNTATIKNINTSLHKTNAANYSQQKIVNHSTRNSNSIFKAPHQRQNSTKNNIVNQANSLALKNSNLALTTSNSQNKIALNINNIPNTTSITNNEKTILKETPNHNDKLVKKELATIPPDIKKINIALANEAVDTKKDSTQNVTDLNKAIAEQKAKKEKEGENDKEDSSINIRKKWNVAPSFGPVYYNTLGNGSPIDSQFNNNKKRGLINTSYGINVSYAITHKFSIRTGIHKLELGYDTQDVAVIPVSGNTNTGGSIDLRGLNSVTGVNLNIGSANNFSISQIPSGFSALYDSSLNQRLGYIEVPLEIGYQISNRKTKINILAGMSTFFLNKNEIYAQTNDIKTYLGTGNNLNQISFSTNIGVGFNYALAKHLNFKVEPSFKYQLNSYNKKTSTFKPYIIGIYTGFSYKF